MRQVFHFPPLLCFVLLLMGLCTGQNLLAQAGVCNGGGCAGPGSSWGATQSTTSPTFVDAVAGTYAGEYNTYNVTAGMQYEWSLCPADGAVNPTADNQLTLKTTGNVNICYADDICGAAAKILWTSNITGQVRVLVNQYNCVTNTNNHTVRWRCVSCGGGGGGNIVPLTGSNTLTACTGTITDHAGASNYSNNANGFTVITPSTAGAAVTLNGSYTTEGCCDFIEVYDGNGLGGAQLARVSGTGTLSVQGSFGAPITLRFVSDGSVVNPGFSFTIGCSSSGSTTRAVPFTGNNTYNYTCGSPANLSFIYDHGGPSGNYLNSANGFQVITPSNPALGIQLTGNFSTEACCDFIRVYAGVGVGGPLIGTFNGTGTLPANVRSQAPGQALTVQFVSDGSVVSSGFAFTASCVSVCNNSVTVAASPGATVCPGTTVTLTANAVGTGPFSYAWSNGATTPSTTTITPGTFTVTVTPTGCATVTASSTITMSAPTAAITVAPPGATICGAGPVQLTAGGGGGGGGVGARFYLRGNVGEPWGSTSNTTIMNTVFGAGNWTASTFETAVVGTVFSPGTGIVFLEGSDGSASALNTFMTANQTAIQNWVAAGGRLFLNAGPNVGGNMNWGFGGVTLNYNSPQGTVNGVVPGHPIFAGPNVPCGTGPFTGGSFSHAHITGGGTTPLVTGGGVNVVTELTWGSGRVIFGGMTMPSFHNPQPNANNLRANILHYLYNVGGGGTFTYQWSTGATTAQINAPTTGTYIVTVTGAGGCSSSAAQAVFINTPPAVAIGGGPVICGAFGVISANVTGGTAPFAYLWNDGTTDDDINVSTNGTYAVTVTDANNCSASISQNITVGGPQVTLASNPPAPYCGNPTVNLIANATLNGAGGTYTVTTIPNNFVPCGANAGPTGDDAVTGANNIGFNFVFNGVTHTQFGISTNGNIQLGAGPYTATFGNGPMPSAGFTSPAIAIAWDDMFADAGDITWGVSGTPGSRMLVVCFNNFTHLGGTPSGEITQGRIILYETTNVVEIHTQTSNNFGSATQGYQFTNALGATIRDGAWGSSDGRRISPPVQFNYLWSTGAITPSISTNVAGTYTVSVSVGACTTTASQTIAFAPGLTASIAGGPGFCAASGVLTATAGGGTAPFSYLWNNGTTNAALTITASGTYAVTITDASGCTASSSVQGTIGAPIVNLGFAPAGPYCGPVNVTVTAAASLPGGGVGGTGGAFYLRTQSGEPWGSASNTASLNAALGAGNWTLGFFETVNVATVFSPSTNFVFIDGSDGGALPLNTFFTTNQTAIQNWVAAGGRLFLNSAPNGGGNMNWGFGGVTLNYNNAQGTVNGVVPAHPIFAGPAVPCGTGPFTGSSFSHAHITGGGTTPLVTGGGFNVASELTWGNGRVIFGGMTMTSFHNPQPNANNLRTNIIAYLYNLNLVNFTYAWSTGATTPAVTVNTNGTYTVTVSVGGCSTTAAQTLSFNPAVAVTIGGGPNICAASGTLTANATGGLAPFAYLWGNGSTTSSVTASLSGAFSVTVTDANGCTASAAQNVTVGIPTVSVAAVPNVPVCPGTTVAITATGNLPGGGGGTNIFYMRGQAGEPWGSASNTASLNAAFGAANWTLATFETANAATIFSPTTRLVFMEGSDASATALNTFFTANQTLIQNWVNGGGRLFLNAGPNVGGNMNWGFGGVTLNYNSAQGTVNGVVPGHPIFAGPAVPCGTGPFTGSSFSHAHITGGGTTPLVTGGGVNVVTELVWGAGRVIFGGMTMTNFHNPQPNANNLRTNILTYLGTGGVALGYAWSNGATTPNISTATPGTYTVTVSAGPCTATASYTMAFETVPPTIAGCPGNISLTAAAGQCSAVATFAAPTATDNCGGNATLASILANFNTNGAAISGTLTNGFNFAMDGGINGTSINDGGNDMYDGGNSLNTSGQAIIQYSDNTILTNATAFGAGGQYFTRYIAAPGNGGPAMFLMAANLNNISTFSTSGNNGADGSGLESGHVFTVTVGTCTFYGYFKRVYNAFDPSINQLVLVNAPGTGQTLPGNTDNNSHIVNGINGATRLYYLLWAGSSGFFYDNNAVVNMATAFLNQVSACPPPPVAVVQTAGPASGSAFPVGVTTVAYTATDQAGNTAQCTFNVTVTDNQAPVITCPGTVAGIRLPGQAGATATFAATATDNCSATVTYSQNPGTIFPVGTTTVVATATDPSGNTATCSFEVFVSGYIFVDQTRTAGGNTGADWTNAFLTVQSAIAASVSNQDTILVAAGTYSPGAVAASTYNLKAMVPIYGGFPNGLNPATWTWNDRNVSANPTILDGGSVNNRVVTANNVGSDPQMTVFDGFTVQNANGTGVAGGMYILANGAGAVSGPIVRNCTFQNNTGANGGGVGVLSNLGANANPTFTDCAFVGNTGKVQGGGLYLLAQKGASINSSIDNCVFENNTAFDPGATMARGGGFGAQAFGGAATITADITGCTFTNNTAEQWGGGIWNYARQGSVCNVNIDGSTFTGNQGNAGGAVHNHAQGGACLTNITGSTFSGNSSTVAGGAVRSYCELNGGNGTLNIENCVFSGNLSAGTGGAVTNAALKGGIADADISKCLFDANIATTHGGALSAHSSTLNLSYPGTSAMTDISNCVFFGNTATIRGGALYNEGITAAPATMNVVNSSFASNQGSTGGALYNGGVSPASAALGITNSVFWNNTATTASSALFHNQGTGASIASTNNSLQNVVLASNEVGSGAFNLLGTNIAGDPLFVNIALGDLHLNPGSPAIDAGTVVALSDDFDGNARPQGNGFDLGAYETGGIRPLARLPQATATTPAPFTATLFPNPTTGAFALAFDRDITGLAQVFDGQGRLVAAQNLTATQTALFDLGAAASGTYLLRIVSDDAVITRQVLVQRP